LREFYIPQSQSQHGIDEELQWVRIIESKNAIKGMVIIFLQKMCAAFHEFEPAYRAGALNESALDYFKDRLARRAQTVLTVLENNDLTEINGYSGLKALKNKTESVQSLSDLADLAEPVHQANHLISDALEKI